MGKRYCFFIGMIALLLMSTACAGPSRLEMDYGTSAKLAKFNQILDPEAVKNRQPVTGLDGEAAAAIMDKYHKDFETPPPPPVYMLGFGGGTAKK